MYNVSRIINQPTAQSLANQLGTLEVFRNGSDYFTYTDIAHDKLSPSQYTNITISQTVVDGTSPVMPIRKMFPR